MKRSFITIQADGSSTKELIDAGADILVLWQERCLTDIVQVVPQFTTVDLRDGAGRVPCLVICDEEGKMKDRQLNIQATRLWAEAIQGHNLDGVAIGPFMKDYLVGPVVICVGDKAWLDAL